MIKNRLSLRSIPGWAIILVFTLIGILAGLYLYRDALFHPEPELSRVDPAPINPEDILTIYSIGQGDPDLLIRLADDTIYRLVLIEDTATWRVADHFPEYYIHDEDCRWRTLDQLQEVAGNLRHCSSLQLPSEWCPGPIISFGISAEGEFWRIEERLACQTFLPITLLVTGGLGLLIGIVVVGLRKGSQLISNRPG